MAAKTQLFEGKTTVFSWNLTTADTDGDELVIPHHSDICISFEDGAGSWGTATAILEGKNHPTVASGEWHPLTDLQGNAISKTADGLEQVQEAPFMIRPRLSVAGSGANITVIVKATRN